VGFDQLSQISGVVVAIISSPRGARASIDVERRGIEVRALGIGVGVSMLDAIDFVSKGNLTDGRELLFDSISSDFSEVWPFASTVAADEAQLTRNPLEGLTEKLDFLSIGFRSFIERLEERFGDLRVEVADEKLDLFAF